MATNIGAYGYKHKSEGKNDECWTHRYAVEPLLEFMEPFKDKIIWCPFDTDESEFVKVFRENCFKVVYSHIKYGEDFYKHEPIKGKWDLIISNPPFTGKKETFERAYSFNKPFALIAPVDWLNDTAPYKVFYKNDMQLLLFNERMTFKNQPAGKQINFKGIYYCRNFLPEQLIIRDFSNRNQMKLFT